MASRSVVTVEYVYSYGVQTKVDLLLKTTGEISEAADVLSF